MSSVEELQADRFRFLKTLYEISGGDEYFNILMYAIGNELQFNAGYTSKIVQHLKGQGLIEVRGIGGIIGISHSGVCEVEKAIEHPEQPTHYFPPVNNITIETMINSSIQQASPDATQVFSQGDIRIAELHALITEIRNSLDKLSLSSTDQQDVNASISTVEAQLTASKPRTTIVSESLSTIRSILEGVAGSTIATGLIASIKNFLES